MPLTGEILDAQYKCKTTTINLVHFTALFLELKM
jgi:hypothetical protein